MFSQRNNPYCDSLHFSGAKIVKKSETKTIETFCIHLKFKRQRP